MRHSHQFRPASDLRVHPPILALEKTIRSDPKVVDEAVKEIAAVLRRFDWLDDTELVALAIREAVNNALVHGNRCDPEKTIRINLTLEDHGSLFVSVKDAGRGFDPNALLNPLAMENLLSNHGRGIFLMRQFMDEVEFNFDHGTEVRMRRNEKWLE